MSRHPEHRKRFLRTKFTAIATLIVVGLLCGLEPAQAAAQVSFSPRLAELPLTFPIQSAQMATYFNQIARPDDIAAFTYRHVDLLPQVTRGQKRVGYPSWAEAERNLPELSTQIKLVAYNAEHWQQTPAAEKENLPETVKRAAETAHSYGLRFMFSPDRRFAQQYVGEVAPYVDVIGLQGQQFQDDPERFGSWMNEVISAARTSNPDVEIYVQVGATHGPATEMMTALETVADRIDGISVWATPRALNTLQEFVTLLRDSSPTVEPTATDSPTATPTAAAAPAESPTPIPPTIEATATSISTPAAVAVLSNPRLPVELSELPLTFPVQSPEIAAFFNQVAGPGDMAAFPQPYAELASQIDVGQTMIVFRSWSEAERVLDQAFAEIDLVGYNPEHWQYTPFEEQQDLPATVRRAAEFVHGRGARFMLVPDRLFADKYLSQVAPHVDVLVLQGQRLQEDPEVFAASTSEMIRVARASNPDMQIFVQVGATRGTALQMYDAIQTISGEIDGIAVWSMPRSLDVLGEFVTLLREGVTAGEAAQPSTAAVAATTDHTVEEEAPPLTSQEVTPEADTLVDVPQESQDILTGNRFLLVAIAAGGIVAGLLLGMGIARRRYRVGDRPE